MKSLIAGDLRKLTLSDYIYINYMKNALRDARFEVEMSFAERAVEAIFDGSLDVLSKPLIVHHRSGEYSYDGDEVAAICCKLGVTDFVIRMITAVECLMVWDMLEKVTTETNLQKELLIRMAAAIELCNPRFLAGNLGVIRDDKFHELLVSSGIAGFVHMAVKD